MPSTLQLEQTKIRFNTVSVRIQISHTSALSFKKSGISKAIDCLSDDNLPVDDLTTSFARGTDAEFDPALFVGAFVFKRVHQQGNKQVKNKIF